MATLGDERQLNDASFNAGLDSGSSYEWTDERNRLHFYVVDKRTDAEGILHYKVAVKSLDGAGPQTRGVALQAARRDRGRRRASGRPARSRSRTRARPRRPIPALHPQDSTAFLTATSTACRASATGTGWTAKLRNALTAVKFGDTVERPGLRHEGRRRLGAGTRLADRDVRERSVEDRRPRSAAWPTATSAAPSRRRSR